VLREGCCEGVLRELYRESAAAGMRRRGVARREGRAGYARVGACRRIAARSTPGPRAIT
jgi:hypothetical protein